MMPPTIDGLPILKPPYGRVTAIDLNKGDTKWVAAIGDGPRNHPLVKDLNLPALGAPIRNAAMVTKTLLFVGEGWGGDPILRAYDKRTGEIVAEVALPGQAASKPMTYMLGGRQFIVLAVGRPGPAEFVALALPD